MLYDSKQPFSRVKFPEESIGRLRFSIKVQIRPNFQFNYSEKFAENCAKTVTYIIYVCR